MSLTLTLPQEYNYVLVASVATVAVNVYHHMLTAKHRKRSGVKYPNAYATDEQAAKDPKAYQFNCAQKSHAQFTEEQASTVTLLLINGLVYPTASAALGGLWAVSRTVYAYGYTNYGPQARMYGAIPAALADLALKGMALFTCYKLLAGA